MYILDIFYFLDLILMTIFKKIHWPEVQDNYPPRNCVILLLEYISLAPFESIYTISDTYFYFVRLRYVYRMVRMFFLLRRKAKIYDSNTDLKSFLQLCAAISIISVTAACIVTPIMFKIESIDYFKVTDFYTLYYTTTSRLTSKGFGAHADNYTSFVYEYVLLCSITLIAFVLTSTFTAQVACLSMFKVKYRFMFAHNYMFMLDRLKLYKRQNIARWKNYHVTFRNTVVKFFQLTWQKMENNRWKRIPTGRIPDVLIRDILLDITWDAFKHSHLFRDNNTFFLRYLCSKMKLDCYTPDEVLVKRNHYKSMMIYIVSGIIQVISEENYETPILSLSGGTCIGESTLVIDYPAKYSLSSKTYSEVICLKRKHFVQLSKDHPSIYQSLIKHIHSRYEQAKQYHKVKQQRLKVHHEISDDLSLTYIKYAAKKLLHNQHGFDKTRFYYILEHGIRERIFCPYYLDLIATTEETELISDTVFIKKTFPFVLQPHSVVLIWWNAFNDLLIGIVIVGYPVLIYITSFHDPESMTTFIISLISFVWTLDIYIKASTAVKTRDRFYTNISSIIYYRLSTIEFIVDLFCTLPFGLLLSAINTNITARLILVLEMHKLLKIYRIFRFVNRMSELNTKLLLLLMYIKAFVVIFIIIYYFTFFLYMLLCSNGCPEKYRKDLKMYYNVSDSISLYTVIHFMTLVSFFINNTSVYSVMDLLKNHTCFLIIVMQLFFYYVYVYLLAKAIAADTVNQQEKHEFKEFVATISVMMHNFKFDNSVERRVWRYLKAQYYRDMGMSFINPNRLSLLMSSNLYSLYRYVIYGKLIAASMLFQSLSQDLIMKVAKRAKTNLFFAGETIIYAGAICKEMHLIVYGFCLVKSRSGATKILKAGDTFSVIEMCFNIPTVNTVVASTDCNIISILLEDYLHIVRKNKVFREQIDNARELCDITRLMNFEEETFITAQASEVDERSGPSFRRFKYLQKKVDNVQFHQGFGKYGQIFKYLLQRHTITTYGSFMFYYECVRCLCAFATNLFCTMINTKEMGFFYYILYFFDVTALLDLYVMHHVCYFNKVGIEISHPMLTAIHYWKHAFLTDFIGFLPLDYMFDAKASTVVYLRMNRLVQLHRIFGFFAHLNVSNIFRTSTIDILKYLPLTVLIMNYVGYLLLHSSCDVGNNHRLGAECASRVLVNKRFKNTTFSRINAQGASLLLVTGPLTMIAIVNLQMKRLAEMICLSILIMFGSVFSIWLTAKIVANNFYRNSDLTSYQQAMRDLINFYNYRKIDKNIKKEIIEHYEHMWKKKKGKDIHKLLDGFNTCFKEDLLFGIFGRYFAASPIFHNVDRTFIKSLLLEMDYKVYLKRAIIYRVNDIHGKIFFLLCGEVDILGPDYNKLTKLVSGSLFGSLDNCLYTRQTLMMVAKSNVEVLEINSISFHYILSRYQIFQKKFRKMTAINVDYIETNLKLQSVLKVKATHTRRSRLCTVYVKINPLYKHNFYMKLWKIFLLIIVDFFGFHLELYQKVTWDTRFSIKMSLYLFDIFYIIKIYLSFHTCFYDQYGIMVKDRKKIALHYIHKKFRFYSDICSTIPLEMLSFMIADSETQLMVFSFLRLNRIIRISFVCIALKNTGEKLDINVVAMRIILIFTWLTIYVHISTVVYYHMRVLLRISRPDFDDSLALYATSLYIMAYTSIGSATSTFNVTYNFWIVFYTVLVTTIGRFIVTLFIAETCATIESINKSKNMYKQFCINLMNFTHGTAVSFPIVKEISEYIQLLWVHHRGIHVPRLLEEAPTYLKEATMNAMFGYHLRQHPIIKRCHVDLIRQMATEMHLLVFFPNNHITYQGDIDHCMYFIHEGMVDVLCTDSLQVEIVVKTLVAGDSFGLIQGLHHRMGQKFTYKVRQHAIINVLQRDKWIHKLVFFPASKLILDECLAAADRGEEFD